MVPWIHFNPLLYYGILAAKPFAMLGAMFVPFTFIPEFGNVFDVLATKE
jgi:hypothetical protein